MNGKEKSKEELLQEIRDLKAENESLKTRFQKEFYENYQVENFLYKSEEKYGYIVENAPLGIFRRTLDGQYNYCNLTLAKHFECDTIDEFLQNYNEIPKRWANPDKHNEFKELLIKTGKVVGFEVESKLINGKTKWFSLYAYLDITNNELNGFSLDITERKQTEQALQKSNQLQKCTFASLHDAIFIIDFETKAVIDCNIAATEIFGYRREEMIGKTTELLHVSRGALDEFRKHLSAGIEENGFLFLPEFSMKRKGGEIFPTEHTVTPLENEQHAQIGWVSLVRDLTERKKTVQSLIESEERYKLLINNIMYPVIVSSLAGQMLYINQKTADFLGLEPSEIQNLKSSDYWVDPSKRDEYIAELQTTGAVRNKEVMFCNKKNEKITVVMSSNMIDYYGQKAIFSIYNDITERKRAEVELQQSKARLSALLSSMKDIVFEIDLNGCFEGYYSQDMKGLYVPADFFISKSFDEVLPTNVSKLLKGAIENINEGKQFEEFEYSLTINDNVQYENAIVTPRYDKSNEIVGITVVCRDITERKFAERALSSLATNFAGLSGKDFFEAVSKHIATEMGLDYVYVGELSDTKDSVVVLGGFALGEAMGEMQYSLVDTPCNDVIENNSCIYTNGVQLQYPKDSLLQQMGINSYFGARIYNKVQEPIGLLVALHSKPFNNPDILNNLFIIFLDRISAEFNRIHTDDALKMSEEKFSKAFQSSPDIIAITSLMDGLIVEVNDRVQDILEYSREEVIGKTSDQLQIWVEPPMRDFYFDRLRQDGYLHDFELKVYSKSGKIIDTLASAEIIELQNKQYIFSTYRDITDRKQVEHLRRKSEEKFSKIFHVSPEAISINRLSDGKYIDANDACLNKTGFTREEIIGKTAIELNIWADPEDRIKYIQAFEKDGKVRNLEIRLRMKSGEIRYFLASTEIVEVEDEICILGFFFDITDRKLEEEELRATTAKLETIIMVSPLAITVVDSIGNVQLWNKAAEQIFGWTAQEVIGHPNPIVPADILNEYTTWTSQILQGKVLTNQEGVRVRKDGSFVYLNISSASIKDANGDLIGRMTILSDITERKLLEDNLKQSEERLSSFMNSATDSFYLLDADFNFIEINRKALEFIGKQKKDIIGKNIEEIVPDIKSSGRYEKHLEVIKTGQPFTIVDFIPHPVFGDKHVVLNSFKVGTGLGIIVSDITLLRKQDLEVKKLLKTIDSTEVSIVVTDTDGYIEYANPFFTQLTGYSKDEFLGKNPKVLNSGTHTDEFYKEMWNTIKSGNTWEGEFCNIKKNGELYWEKSIITPIKNENEEIINFVAVKSDITNEKKHKDLIDITLELYKNSEHLTIEEILKYSIELGIKLTDSEIGFFHFVNADQETISLQAWSAKTMDICNIPTLDKHYSISKAGVWVDCFYQKKSVIHNDYSSLPHKKGLPEGHASLTRDLAVPVVIENQVVAIFGVGNKKLDYNMDDAKFLSIFADNVWNVVRRKSAEIDAINAKEKAEESEKLKTAFLQNMSHEIRTPLNGILGFSNLLQSDDLTNEDIKEFTGVIQKSGQRLMETVGNVLDMSKIETGQIEVENKSFSLNSLISNLYTFFSNTATLRDVIFEYNVALSNSDSFIESDELKLNQILSNLINNSLKFTNNGKIVFGYSIIDDEIVFYVKDTGIGIPEEFKHRIFVRFAQVNLSISRGYEGAGLGLAICKGLVELLNGKIRFESEINIGTTFFVSIPYKPISLFVEDNDIPTILPQNEQIKILIVEDDWASYQYVKKLFSNTDYSIIHAENGKDAVEIVKCTPDIKLILMDIRMPVMNGVEATKIIKQIKPDLPIIAQTAYAFSTERDEILSIGCSDYMSKPIQESDLFALIEKYS